MAKQRATSPAEVPLADVEMLGSSVVMPAATFDTIMNRLWELEELVAQQQARRSWWRPW